MDDSAMSIDVPGGLTNLDTPLKAIIVAGSGNQHVSSKLNPIHAAFVGWVNGPTNREPAKRCKELEVQVRESRIPELTIPEEKIEYIKRSTLLFSETQQISDLTIPNISRLSELQRSALKTHILQYKTSEVSQSLLEHNSILQCAEALYLPKKDGMPNGDALMDWVNNLDPKPEQHEGVEIMQTRPPCSHPLFWDYVHRAVLRGLLPQTSLIFSKSGLERSEPAISDILKSLIDVLDTFPLAKAFTTIEEFKRRRDNWLSHLSYKLPSLSNRNPSNNLKIMLDILEGNIDIIKQSSSTWQEYFAASACYCDLSDFQTREERWTDVTEGFAVDITLPFEVICGNLCEGDIPKALTNCKGLDLGLAAILSDLLEKADVLQDPMDLGNSEGPPFGLRDYFCIEYGELLMMNEATWREACIIWQSVPGIGIEYIQNSIIHIPLESKQQIEDLLTISDSLDLFFESAYISTSWARHLERQSKFGSAITYLHRARYFSQIDRLVWKIFENTLLFGPMSIDDELKHMIGNPGNCPVEIANLIAPVATLRGFYEQTGREKRRWLAALFKAPRIPRRCVGMLMCEMLPLLDGSNLWTYRDLFDCLPVIEEFYSGNDFQEGINLVQLAIDEGRGVSWRQNIRMGMIARDIIAVVRMLITKEIGRVFLDGKPSEEE
ncbi:Nucleoporin nup85 [Neolecta irregularis DAH-3]|uniref:Nuclear pore complex protein Nup85 n=1 Tax=Neolecta irregularis (strain DAH-3) TaxID=1198029 RepID=A0A1U7LQN3_NEOID|nr:Nucleoporin nup85 [Neolecta irregularis DAH-3]|eukprot:OLL24862.1 Nucleoporin nup85 [Neolecta irregularis DAH-3]